MESQKADKDDKRKRKAKRANLLKNLLNPQTRMARSGKHSQAQSKENKSKHSKPFPEILQAMGPSASASFRSLPLEPSVGGGHKHSWWSFVLVPWCHFIGGLFQPHLKQFGPHFSPIIEWFDRLRSKIKRTANNTINCLNSNLFVRCVKTLFRCVIFTPVMAPLKLFKMWCQIGWFET